MSRTEEKRAVYLWTCDLCGAAATGEDLPVGWDEFMISRWRRGRPPSDVTACPTCLDDLALALPFVFHGRRPGPG